VRCGHPPLQVLLVVVVVVVLLLLLVLVEPELCLERCPWRGEASLV
jgi:hypothetical protein